MIQRINYLPTPTSLPGETGLFRIISTFVSDGIWLISRACKCLAARGSVWLQFSQICVPEQNMCDMYNQYSLTGVGSVRSADLCIFSEIESVRSAHVYRWVLSICGICIICRICVMYLSGICVICIICTPEWGMYDLHDMHIFIGVSA